MTGPSASVPSSRVRRSPFSLLDYTLLESLMISRIASPRRWVWLGLRAVEYVVSLSLTLACIDLLNIN